MSVEANLTAGKKGAAFIFAQDTGLAIRNYVQDAGNIEALIHQSQIIQNG